MCAQGPWQGQGELEVGREGGGPQVEGQGLKDTGQLSLCHHTQA